MIERAQLKLTEVPAVLSKNSADPLTRILLLTPSAAMAPPPDYVTGKDGAIRYQYRADDWNSSKGARVYVCSKMSIRQDISGDGDEQVARPFSKQPPWTTRPYFRRSISA